MRYPAKETAAKHEPIVKEAARLLQCALGRGQSLGRGGWLLWNGSDRTNSFEQPAITEISAREQAAGQR